MSDAEKAVDEWVECTTCGKWRKLPAGISAGSLPDEWYCKDNSWDARLQLVQLLRRAGSNV